MLPLQLLEFFLKNRTRNVIINRGAAEVYNRISRDENIVCSGSVVEDLSKINILQSTTRSLGQNIQYTELNSQYEQLE